MLSRSLAVFFHKARRKFRNSKTQVVFYGILLNAQLAAYAFTQAFHWIHVNMKKCTSVCSYVLRRIFFPPCFGVAHQSLTPPTNQ